MNKTEQIRDKELREEFRNNFVMVFPDILNLYRNGQLSSEKIESRITDFWLQKMSEQQQSILEEVEGLKKELKGIEDSGYVLDTVISITKK